MAARLLLLVLAAALASANPLTITFVGVGNGELGNVQFTGESFTFTFTTDTSAIMQPGSIAPPFQFDFSTISGTPATIAIAGVMGGSAINLTGTQSVFDNPTENRFGIWTFDESDFMTITSPVFGSYNIASNLSHTSNSSEFATPSTAFPLPTADGNLSITSLSALSVNVAVGSSTPTGPGSPGTVAGVPEPSTLSMLLIGAVGVIGGLVRRRTA